MSYPLGGPGRGLCAWNREFAVVQVGVSSRAREPTAVAVLFRPAPVEKAQNLTTAQCLAVHFVSRFVKRRYLGYSLK